MIVMIRNQHKGIRGEWVVLGAILIIIVIFISQQQTTIENGGITSPTPTAPLTSPIPSDIATTASAEPTRTVTIVTLTPEEFSSKVEGAPPIHTPEFEKEVCGNGICDTAERCDTCFEDCGCEVDEYCSTDNGLCYEKEVCGDNICTDLEKSGGSCCTDCGCTGGQICNLFNEKCLNKVDLSDAEVATIIDRYLKENKVDWETIRTYDSFYEKRAVKAAELDCEKTAGAWCLNTILIDGNGEVIANFFAK